MKLGHIFFFVILLSSIVSSFDTLNSSPGEQTLSGDCQVISAPGNYVLDQDIVRRPEVDTPKTECSPETLLNKSNIAYCYANSACLLIEAPDVSLDCKGHKIVIGDWVQQGIYIDYPSEYVTKATIKNCVIDRPRAGIIVRTGMISLRGYFDNNSIYDALENGYYIWGTDSILDCHGQKITSGRNGIEIAKSYNATIRNCIVENGINGIYSLGYNNTFDNNSVYNTSSYGYFFSDTGSIISNNIYSQQGPGGVDGFHMIGKENRVAGNSAKGTNGSCFFIEGAGDRFMSNKAEQCDFGFHIVGKNNELTNNEATGNKQDGFMVERRALYNVSGNVLRNNIARNNGRYGFNLDDSKNTFGDNVDEGNPYGSLFNNPVKEFFDGIMLWFRELFGG